MSNRRRATAAVLGVMAVFAAYCTVSEATSPQPAVSAIPAPPALPSTSTSAPAPSSAPASTDPSEPAATSSPTPVEAAPPLSLTVTSADGAPILATSDLGVDIGTYDPRLASDGETYRPVVLPEGNWEQAAWIRYDSDIMPSSQTPGTVYVVGHACRLPEHHCPFTNLYQASVGDKITVTTSRGIMTYRINLITTISKENGGAYVEGSVTDQAVPNRFVAETCSYNEAGESVDNLMVSADLVEARPVS